MSAPITRSEILKLYKHLMSYSKSLRFTDVEYYKKRVSAEFRQNKTLSNPEDIDFAYKKGEALLRRGSIFVRGGGPGGSAVNKNANCVVLTHVPSGVVVKCHLSRSQDDNRKMAREMLVAKLDEMMNGEESINAQKKRLEENKLKKSDYKKKKRAKLKEEWKKREGL
ncbi:unnamed protein product [Leptosia nina]|uniref:Prokaryotic-type class I peptide chain release factors domain-containing protein n=1 Tax=Leptosia nina TaxID=320188 RepID=A0AAV1J983_9NEOP